MSDMTETFTPTEQLVLEVLQARCVRLGEEQWYFENRLKPVLRRLADRGFIGFQSYVQGAQMVWLNKDNPAWAGFFDPRPDEFKDLARDFAALREKLQEVEQADGQEYPIGAFQGLANVVDDVEGTEPDAADDRLSWYRRVMGTAAEPTTLRVLTGWACAALCVVALIAVMVGLYMIPERWQNWVALGAFALCCLGGAAMIWISASEEAMRRRHRTTGGEDK